MRKILALCLCLLIAFISGGCWDRRELDTLAIVTAIGVDKSKDDDKFILTYQILKPRQIKSQSSSSQESSGKKGIWELQSSGNTLFDAIRNATAFSARKLFASQNRIIIIGEEIARSGILPVLDLFSRDPESRLLSYILIAKGDAKDILGAEHQLESIPAEAIEGLVKGSENTSKSVVTSLLDFEKKLSPFGDTVASKIELTNKNNLKVVGSAVFKDGKLKGFLSPTETRGLNWINGKIKSGIIIVKSPKDESKNVSLEIIRANSNVIPEIRNGKPYIKIIVNEEGNLAEQMSSVNLINIDALTILEKRKSQVIKNEIYAVLQKAQNWETDIFGFGTAFSHKYPKEWETLKTNWRKTFSELDVEVVVNAKLRTIGILTRPIRPEL